MKVKVLAFSSARVFFGFSEREIVLENLSQTTEIAQLLDGLNGGWKMNLPGLRVACDSEFVPFSMPLKGGETIALIPPVSGG